MELNDLSTKDKPLLKRKHITANLSFEGKTTPSNWETAQAIAKKLDTKPELVAIRKIATAFDKATATVDGFVYETVEDLEKTESKKMMKDGPPGEKKAEEKAEEKKPEAKKEEAKEAPKAEPKKEAPAEEKKE